MYLRVGRNWQLSIIANSLIKIAVSTPPKFKILENRLLNLAQDSSDRKNVSVASPDADFRKWRYALLPNRFETLRVPHLKGPSERFKGPLNAKRAL